MAPQPTPMVRGMGIVPMLAYGIVAGGTLLFGALSKLFTGDTAERTSSNLANQAEPILKANLAAFQNGQIDKTTALSNFDSIWSQFVAAESSPQTLNHGSIAVTDRQPGGKWDWFSYYRTPIESAPDTSTTDTLITSASSLVSGGGWIWPAIAVVGLFLVMGEVESDSTRSSKL
jgi:hypothetical protein